MGETQTYESPTMYQPFKVRKSEEWSEKEQKAVEECRNYHKAKMTSNEWNRFVLEGSYHFGSPRDYQQYEEQNEQPDFDSAELTFTYNQLFRETRFSGRDRLDDQAG